uniref:Rubisco operon transcriptional regulator n=1 Tax=uncultured organism TaxID=155900 RepID=E3T307_9ZZZZ|nr:rubisco operon transcriptional regulator [uncultured organism]
MKITFRQLTVFETAARFCSFTRTAETLYMSQPAVSMQIKQLEETVGLPLFEQVGKKLYLTEAGEEFAQYSRKILQLLSEAETVWIHLKASNAENLLSQSPVRLAVLLHACWLSSTSALKPSPLAWMSPIEPACSTILEQNDIDMAIMGKPPTQQSLQEIQFADNPLVVIAAPTHPLVSKKNIPWEQLQDETFVIRERGSGTRSAMERFCEEQNSPLNTGMEMTSNEAIKQAVQAGLGLGVVSQHTLELELQTEQLIVLDVKLFPILRHWYIVHRSNKRLSPAAQHFKDFVLSTPMEALNKS